VSASFSNIDPTLIRVGLVEDDAAMRASLVRLLNETPGFACAAECSSAEEAFEVIPREWPDVVLMDIGLPGRDGIQCVAELHYRMPELSIIMLTIEENIERVFQCLQAGATGYLVKLAESQEILDAIAEVHRGGAPMSSSIARRVVTAFREPSTNADASLSQREREVLNLLAKGNRTRDVADALGIGVSTVNTYIQNIYEKLHVRSRTEAIARYKGIKPLKKPKK
jgi:DNA-binding NarL/FixJ family response regulator